MTSKVGRLNPAQFIQQYNTTNGKDITDNGTGAPPLLTTRITTNIEKLKTKNGRLETFKLWPNKQIDPEKLADAGFYYRGPADVVQCFVCGIKGHNWLKNDNPMDDHMKWNKNCQFVRENTTEHDNAQHATSSPSNAQNQQQQTATSGHDICGNLNVEIHPNSEPEDTVPTSFNNDNVETSTNFERLNFYKATGPSHPDQITYETRLATFENWPISIRQKPAELADAGFYYLGLGDQTLCFYCGGGLKDWIPEDDPWEQHAKWFPKCNYLLLKKGRDYVENVQTIKAKHEKNDEIPTCSSSSSSSSTKETDDEVERKNKTEEKEKENSDDEKNKSLCKICYKNEVGIVFVPCGHIVACVDCGPIMKECPVCRKNIELILRAFLS